MKRAGEPVKVLDCGGIFLLKHCYVLSVRFVFLFFYQLNGDLLRRLIALLGLIPEAPACAGFAPGFLYVDADVAAPQGRAPAVYSPYNAEFLLNTCASFCGIFGGWTAWIANIIGYIPSESLI